MLKYVSSIRSAMRRAALGPHVTRRVRRVVMLILLPAITAASCRSACSRKYEYDEDVFLELDGSATIYVNASVPALVALRGADLDVNPRARLDRDDVRALYTSPVTRVMSITTSRRANGRTELSGAIV